MEAGKSGPVTMFARNRLCALVRLGLSVTEGRADIFLTDCTATREATREYPAQQMIWLPDALSVGADYGLTVVNGASDGAQHLAHFILAPEAQTIFARHGFAVPAPR